MAARSYASIITDIKYRLKKLEGTACQKYEFECGDDQYQCVSELLACDRVKDCSNGRDEDQKFCDTTGFSAGTLYSSWPPIHRCMRASRGNVFFTNFVISVKRSKIFQPLLQTVLKGASQVNGQNLTMIAEGGYLMLGTRRSVAFLKSGDRSHCQFMEDSFDRMYCDAYIRGLHTPCMENVVTNKVYPTE